MEQEIKNFIFKQRKMEEELEIEVMKKKEAIAKLEQVLYEKGPLSQKDRREKRAENERKDREIKKLKGELQRVSRHI